MPEAIPSANFLLQGLIALAFVIWLVMNSVKLAHLLSGKKEVHKAEVTMASDYASQADIRALADRVEANEATGAARRRAIYEEIKKSADRTDVKIESVNEKIEDVRKEIKEDIRGVSNLLTEVIRKS